jgi:glycosyltransferase involved in cell wall biosynthesis
MNNKITIITPSFNQGQFIERAIKSVLSQKGDFFIDYIVADGGSTDNSVEIIKKYDDLLKAKKYPIECRGIDFRWWSKPDSGQSQAINQGFKIANGDILAWINCDDYYEPGAFDFVIGKFKENPEVDLIYGDSYGVIMDSEKSIIKPEKVDFSKMLNTGYQLNQPAVFFTKRICDKVGLLDESLRYAMDFDLWLRVLKVSKTLYIPRVLATFELWSGCKGIKYGKKFSVETRKVCRKYDKNPLSKRSVSMFFGKFNLVKYFKVKLPKCHQFCKNCVLFFYQ